METESPISSLAFAKCFGSEMAGHHGLSSPWLRFRAFAQRYGRGPRTVNLVSHEASLRRSEESVGSSPAIQVLLRFWANKTRCRSAALTVGPWMTCVVFVWLEATHEEKEPPQQNQRVSLREQASQSRSEHKTNTEHPRTGRQIIPTPCFPSPPSVRSAPTPAA